MIDRSRAADDQAGLQAAERVRNRSAQVLRPPGAFDRLDRLAAHLARWQRTDRPTVDRPHVLVFAADHGVAAAGVSAFPPSITTEMLAAVSAGRATINAMANVVGATVHAVDVGVGRPTGDIRTDTAVTRDRFDEITTTAETAVDDAVDAGADVLVLGELGIGNTTVAAALAAHFVGGDIIRFVGRGTGIDDAGLARKAAAVRAAIGRLDRTADPTAVACEIGGAELLAMAAACRRARQHSLPVVLDGYICCAAMLPLAADDPSALTHCIAGHRSAEPGHGLVLEHLGLEPVLALDLRLGEGSGAVAALGVLRLAVAAVTDVATFDEWFADREPGS